jgi:hypothetical protein
MVSAMNDYLFPWHAIRFYHPIRVIGSERAKIYSSAFGANRFSGKECLEGMSLQGHRSAENKWNVLK